MNTTIFDEVISEPTLYDLYTQITNTGMWSIGRVSKKKNYHAFPGHIIKEHTGEVFNPLLCGFFSGIVEQLRQRYYEAYNDFLPTEIMRIHLGAKNPTSYTEMHTDTNKKGVSIVGFLTPEWKPEWNGRLKIEDNFVDYIPGRFAIFDTNKMHDGEGPSTECPYWRISVNIILVNKDER
jgi:hypothetical protein